MYFFETHLDKQKRTCYIKREFQKIFDERCNLPAQRKQYEFTPSELFYLLY